MTLDVCPYCRSPISVEEAGATCEGCGTRHHADCYAENGGCTIFGCSCAPAEEPKLMVSAPELVSVPRSASATVNAPAAVAPPPPPGGAPQASLSDLRQVSSTVVPSMYSLFGTELATAPTYNELDAVPVPHSEPKSRTTYIVLGALLGAVGAHNFYAGYTKKAVTQLLITGLTLGFGSPMSWIWAIIDICTVNQDKLGVQFES